MKNFLIFLMLLCGADAFAQSSIWELRKETDEYVLHECVKEFGLTTTYYSPFVFSTDMGQTDTMARGVIHWKYFNLSSTVECSLELDNGLVFYSSIQSAYVYRKCWRTPEKYGCLEYIICKNGSYIMIQADSKRTDYHSVMLDMEFWKRNSRSQSIAL